ncbi:uncharacterized protein N7483_000686 [Penicillium malachiteum]|uniref:uncharacterized protein n=1 Tax=Penicillium malachiteum TaxID=1324776 RepID=UPI0025471CE4|nr:uncharacterized protein N7483_000686 [Penicillium malachiteum]KAJ5735561.1 hypothetical protein N7483_000686 [Penicillium malachiteum]
MGSFAKIADSEWVGSGRYAQLKIKYDGLLYEPYRFSDMLVAEYALRESVQREEILQYKIQGLEKAVAIEPDGKAQLALADAKSELDKVEIQCYHNQQALYRTEATFIPRVKRDYDTLRTDDNWYMREEMAQDCADKGGCCSRGCGCCARRKLSEKRKGTGYCTLECWCCSIQRGFEVPCEENQEIQQKYKEMLEGSNQTFLLHSINCLVSPLKCQPEVPVPVPSKSL